ncbi:MAG: hypothetical protein WBA99_03960 [Nodosilinea sp.]
MTPRLAPSPLTLPRPPKPQRQPDQRGMGKSRSWLGSLCVVVSLVAHGAVLVVAMPDSSTEPEAIAEEPLDEVAVTVLPKAPTAPEPAPTATAPPTAVNVVPPRPVPVQQPMAQPQRPVPQAQAAVTPAAPPPAPPAAIAPEPAFTPPPAAAEPEPPALYANFPHLDGAQAACEGLADCWRSPVSSSWRGAANDLKERLEAQGFTLSNVTGEVLSIDSGARVYAVSKPGEADYYLNLVSVREGVLYTMTAEPMTSAQVLALQRS